TGGFVGAIGMNRALAPALAVDPEAVVPPTARVPAGIPSAAVTVTAIQPVDPDPTRRTGRIPLPR
ncbi:MAG: hypothetical protein ABMB14_29040, partial [Myxococcota bacterium]